MFYLIYRAYIPHNAKGTNVPDAALVLAAYTNFKSVHTIYLKLNAVRDSLAQIFFYIALKRLPYTFTCTFYHQMSTSSTSQNLFLFYVYSWISFPFIFDFYILRYPPPYRAPFYLTRFLYYYATKNENDFKITLT